VLLIYAQQLAVQNDAADVFFVIGDEAAMKLPPFAVALF